MGRGTEPRGAPRARVLATRRVYEGKVLSLDVDEVEEPGDVRAEREVVRHRGSVAVLPVHDDGRLVLVRQYRYPVDALVWELPAGRLDAGESAEEAARRELEEEVGLRPRRLEHLGELKSVGVVRCDQRRQQSEQNEKTEKAESSDRLAVPGEAATDGPEDALAAGDHRGLDRGLVGDDTHRHLLSIPAPACAGRATRSIGRRRGRRPGPRA